MRRPSARLLLIAAGAALIGAGPAPTLLSTLDLDPALVLPPPPAPNSPQAREELAELQAIERIRTPARLAAAQRDSATKSAAIFADAIGTGFDLARLPATARLMNDVRAAEKVVADRAKAHFRRDRPWVVAPKLKTCGRDDDEPWSSYPSGHTTMAYSMGAILARLVPDRATAIMSRAAVYSESRLVCEVHFRSDVTAGETLGLVVAERLMQNPVFEQEFVAARGELSTALGRR